MGDEPEKLSDADPGEFIQAVAFALRYDGRKRSHTGDEFMARITAERLHEALTRSGFVIKKRPPDRTHSSSDFMPRLKD